MDVTDSDWRNGMEEIESQQNEIDLGLMEFKTNMSECLDKICIDRIKNIRALAEELERMQHGTNVATITGASAGIVGGGLGIAGVSLALAPATFGASAAVGLTVAGALVGGAGATTGIASVATKHRYEKSAKKTTKKILQCYKEEVSHMKLVQDKFEEICMKDIDRLECSRDHGMHYMKTKSASGLSTLKYYRDKLYQINRSIKCMLEGNNMIKKNKDGYEQINMSELITMEELLDHYDSLNAKILAIVEGKDSKPEMQLDEEFSDFYMVDVVADGIPGQVGAVGPQALSMSGSKGLETSKLSTAAKVGTTVRLSEMLEEAGRGGAAASTAAKVGTAMKVSGITLAALGVILDAVTLGTTAKEIHQGSQSTLAKKLKEIADDMEKEINQVKQELEQEGDAPIGIGCESLDSEQQRNSTPQHKESVDSTASDIVVKNRFTSGHQRSANNHTPTSQQASGTGASDIVVLNTELNENKKDMTRSNSTITGLSQTSDLIVPNVKSQSNRSSKSQSIISVGSDLVNKDGESDMLSRSDSVRTESSEGSDVIVSNRSVSGMFSRSVSLASRSSEGSDVIVRNKSIDRGLSRSISISTNSSEGSDVIVTNRSLDRTMSACSDCSEVTLSDVYRSDEPQPAHQPDRGQQGRRRPKLTRGKAVTSAYMETLLQDE